MTMEEHMNELDQEVKQLSQKVDNTMEVLGSMNEKLKKLDVIEQGIFGDPKLDYPGILKTITVQEQKIRELEEKVFQIEKKNNEQDIAINAKKHTNNQWFEWGKEAVKMAVQAFILYLIMRGFLSPDAAL